MAHKGNSALGVGWEQQLPRVRTSGTEPDGFESAAFLGIIGCTTLLAASAMPTLLFLGANPLDTERIRLDEEYREIEGCLSSISSNPIRIVSKWAVRPQDLQKALLEISPALVHFSGHGDQDGQILLENAIGYPEPVRADAFADLFRSFSSSVRCVVLNACDSAEQARQLVQCIDCAIGMDGSVSVGAGKAFATSFYQALAYGKDVSTAFELGRNQIRLENLDEEEIPQLYFREGVEHVFLAATAHPAAQAPSVAEALVRAQLSLTTTALGLTEGPMLSAVVYEDEPPPIVEKCSKRQITVRRIQAELAGRPWYAMYGGSGAGKTHLGVLLARQFAGRCVWIRLRDRTAAQALAIIEGTFTSIKPRQPAQTRAVWYGECCTALRQDGVIVLDDLPRTSGRQEIDDALVFLVRAIRRAKAELITISPYPLPPPLRAAVGDEILEEVVPAFSEAEVLELLAAYDAPAAFLTEAWAGTVLAVCRRHPLLITEAARYFEAHGWVVSGQTFLEGFSGKYAINLDLPTQDDLLRTIPDSDTRELLYRLRLVGGAFSGADVRALSSIPKSLDHPPERLTSLVGLWIQPDGPDRYLVSPLVSRLTDSNLSADTERQVHQYLASSLVRERPITALTAVQAITHFVAAELYQDAGMLLLSSLVGYLKEKKPKDDFLLSEMWSHTSLPTQMPLGLRIGIRTTQISIYQEKQRDPAFLLADLEWLVASEELPPQLKGYDLLLGGIAGLALWSRQPAEAIRYGVNSLRSLRDAPKKVLNIPSKWMLTNYYHLLWSALSQVKTSSDLRRCLDYLGGLQAVELSRWAESRFAGPAAEMVCDEIWLREHRKPESGRDWDEPLRTLNFIVEWARTHGVPLLHASAQRGIIVILAEYLKRLDDAIALGEQALAAVASDPRAVFCLADILGRQYYYVDRPREALAWLTRALESHADVTPQKKAYVTALAGINAAQLNEDSAAVLLSEASEIAVRHPKEMPAVLAASIHAELGFEQWGRGERVSAFGALSRTADLLLNMTEAGNDWKIAITLFGNFAGYYAHIANGNSDDSWPYARPFAGCIFDKNSRVLDLFDPAKIYAIAAQLTLLAESLGLHDDALRWAGRANLADFDLGMHSVMVPYRVAAHAAERRFTEAIRDSWIAYAAGAPSSCTDERQIRFNRQTGKVSTVIVGLSLAKLRVERGSGEAARVTTVIEEQLRQLAASEPDTFWSALLEGMRQIAAGSKDWRSLYEAGREWEEREETQLGIVYRLAAMMNAAPSQAFNLTMYTFQKQLIPWLSDTPYQTIVIPFLRAYWRWSFGQYSFHFSAPARAERELEDALLVPGDCGLRNALRVIARYLGIAVPEKHQEYLSALG